MWEVFIRPADRGVVVEVRDGERSSVVGRVGWRRHDTTNPFLTFKRSLRRVIARAEEEADRMNALGAVRLP